MKLFKTWRQRRKATREALTFLGEHPLARDLSVAQKDELVSLRRFFPKEKMGSWLERVALYRIASKLPADACVVEIGSWVGVSTTYLGCGLKSGRSGRIYAVDTFKGTTLNSDSQGVWDQAVAKLGGTTLAKFHEHMTAFRLETLVSPVESTSVEAARNWAGGPIDMLFIDGDHVYDAVKQDFEVWFPYLRRGGLVAFHDYDARHPDVTRFVDEALASPLKGFKTQSMDSLLFVQTRDCAPTMAGI